MNRFYREWLEVTPPTCAVILRNATRHEVACAWTDKKTLVVDWAAYDVPTPGGKTTLVGRRRSVREGPEVSGP